jgi:uncharacterized protein YndB with AHSA1/START domain
MSTAKPTTPLQLEVRRVVPFPRARVFHAWTDPAALRAWFHPGPQLSTPVAEVDLRVGGRYRIVMQTPETQFVVSGVYREIQPPSRVVFTWRWEHDQNEPETLVTVELIEQSPSMTEVVLRHTGFARQEECDSHQVGWIGTLEQLAVVGVRSGG